VEQAPTTPAPYTRRRPYGENPTLGRRGQDARAQILEAARSCFTEHGYVETSIDDIATTAGRSRAAVYQYFENKNDIFLTFVYELGADLLRATRVLTRFTPDAAGAEELRVWLDGLIEVVDRHSTTFLLWETVETTEHTLHAPAASFVDTFAATVDAALARSDVEALDARAWALAILTMIERFTLLRLDRPELFADTGVGTLVEIVQRALFPSAPVAPVGQSARPRQQRQPASTRPAISTSTLAAPDNAPAAMRTEVGASGAATARSIVTAATRLLVRQGFRRTSVSEIAREAGVAHTSVYRYWGDQAGIVRSLVLDQRSATAHLIKELGRVDPGPGCAPELRAWLAEYLDRYEGQAAVTRIWAHERAVVPELAAASDEVVLPLLEALDGLLRRAPLPASLDPGTATLALFSLLTQFPYNALVIEGWPDTDRMLDTLTAFICRGFLGTRH
jgi:AcrR family transcriptional regulator